MFFGEAVPNLSKAARLVQQADVLLIIGTSMCVYPAAGLYSYAQDGCDIYMIDPSENPAATVLGVNLIKKVATEGMKEFERIMKKENNR